MVPNFATLFIILFTNNDSNYITACRCIVANKITKIRSSRLNMAWCDALETTFKCLSAVQDITSIRPEGLSYTLTDAFGYLF